MKGVAGTDGAAAFPPEILTDRPTPARTYGWLLGGKDNFQVDRDLILTLLESFPEAVDEARANRRFLYRAVRYLARDVGITQFLDLGSGLPTDSNVHQVAQAFQPDARVVYVDNDPIVLAHGRALLDEDANTTVIQADMTDPDSVLDAPETQALLDFDRPVGVLMFSIPHCIPDDEDARHAILAPMWRVVAGSHLAISHVVVEGEATAEAATEYMNNLGMPWRTRTPERVRSWLGDLTVVEPGLVDINDWRPDPNQPSLPDVAEPLRPYLGVTRHTAKQGFEFGGVLRKP
ncbi:SAM-dependent methyltransferase [Spiractinospora alimapuensis]|nr:SAM-dependent methyltransferase [Spiractinospora alimapuensis]